MNLLIVVSCPPQIPPPTPPSSSPNSHPMLGFHLQGRLKRPPESYLSDQDHLSSLSPADLSGAPATPSSLALMAGHTPYGRPYGSRWGSMAGYRDLGTDRYAMSEGRRVRQRVMAPEEEGARGEEGEGGRGVSGYLPASANRVTPAGGRSTGWEVEQEGARTLGLVGSASVDAAAARRQAVMSGTAWMAGDISGGRGGKKRDMAAPSRSLLAAKRILAALDVMAASPESRGSPRGQRGNDGGEKVRSRREGGQGEAFRLREEDLNERAVRSMEEAPEIRGGEERGEGGRGEVKGKSREGGDGRGRAEAGGSREEAGGRPRASEGETGKEQRQGSGMVDGRKGGRRGGGHFGLLSGSDDEVSNKG